MAGETHVSIHSWPFHSFMSIHYKEAFFSSKGHFLFSWYRTLKISNEGEYLQFNKWWQTSQSFLICTFLLNKVIIPKMFATCYSKIYNKLKHNIWDEIHWKSNSETCKQNLLFINKNLKRTLTIRIRSLKCKLLCSLFCIIKVCNSYLPLWRTYENQWKKNLTMMMLPTKNFVIRIKKLNAFIQFVLYILNIKFSPSLKSRSFQIRKDYWQKCIFNCRNLIFKDVNFILKQFKASINEVSSRNGTLTRKNIFKSICFSMYQLYWFCRY